MPTASSLLDRASNAKNLQNVLKSGFGGILFALAGGIISGILSVTDVVVKPTEALADALGDLVTAMFGGPAEIILAGVQATAQSLLGPFNVGPFTFALSIGSVLLGLWVLGRYRQETETGNLIPGLPIDIPWAGQNEEAD